MLRFSTLAVLVLALTACGNENASGFSYDGPVTDIDWTVNAAEHRGQDGTILGFDCSDEPEPDYIGSVWGTQVYSDDSSICAAGLHAGAITRTDGGLVVIEMRPGQESYSGTMSNGLESRDWGSWAGSFVVLNGN